MAKLTSAKTHHGIRKTKADYVFDAVNITIMVALMFLILYPLYFTVIASFSDPYAVVNGHVTLWPVNPTFEPYMNVLKESRIWVGYRNNLINVPLGTLWNLILTIPTAYVMSKKKLHGRSFFATFFSTISKSILITFTEDIIIIVLIHNVSFVKCSFLSRPCSIMRLIIKLIQFRSLNSRRTLLQQMHISYAVQPLLTHILTFIKILPEFLKIYEDYIGIIA